MSWTLRELRRASRVLKATSAIRYVWHVRGSRGGELKLKLKNDARAPIYLRGATADIDTFDAVYLAEIYRAVTERVPSASCIVDLGANTGLAARYFAEKYPKAFVLAIEPDSRNFDVLLRNTALLRSAGRCDVHRAAVWNARRALALSTPEGQPLDALQYSPAVEDATGVVEGVPIEEILSLAPSRAIDILKVDIEGAEAQLFAGECSWLAVVRSLAVEFHGSLRTDLGFDGLARRHGFAIEEPNRHTLLAVRS